MLFVFCAGRVIVLLCIGDCFCMSLICQTRFMVACLFVCAVPFFVAVAVLLCFAIVFDRCCLLFVCCLFNTVCVMCS